MFRLIALSENRHYGPDCPLTYASLNQEYTGLKLVLLKQNQTMYEWEKTNHVADKN